MSQLRQPRPHRLATQELWPMLGLFLLVLVASAAVGLASYRYQRATMERQARLELSYLAQAQRDHLELWLASKTRDADAQGLDPFINTQFAALLLAPGADHGALQERIQDLQNIYKCRGIRLLDRQARTIISTDLDPLSPSEQLVALELAAGAPSRLVWSLSGAGLDRDVRVSYLVPMRPGKDVPAIGVLVLDLNFDAMRVAILHDQPTFRATGETMLVCQMGGQMVFLSQPRLVQAPVLGEGMKGRAKAAMEAFLSGRGASDWVDYRGVPCLAAFRQLSSLPWTIFAKMDREEISARLLRLALAYTLAQIVFTAVLALLLITWWRKKQAVHRAGWEHVQREKAILDRQLKNLSRYANDIVLLLDAGGRVLDANDRAVDAYGYPREELLGIDVRTLCASEAQRASLLKLQQQENLGSLRFETEALRKDGSTFWIEVSSRIFTQDGTTYIQSIGRDVTERRRAETSLRESEAKFRGVVNQPLVGIALFEGSSFNYSNPRFAETFGYSLDEIAQRTMLELTAEADRPLVAEQIRRRLSHEVERVEYTFRGLRKDGTEVDIEASGSTLEVDGKLLLICIVKDITQRREAEAKVLALQEQLREQSIRDGLTGLYNRRYLDETLDRELLLAQRNGQPIGVIMGDLDHFKAVNDRYGHLAGDEVLRAFGKRVLGASRRSDICCRYGGEEFLLILPDMTQDKAYQRADELRAQIAAAPVPFGSLSIAVTASFGVASFPDSGGNRQELIAAADRALYAAKEAGRNQVGR